MMKIPVSLLDFLETALDEFPGLAEKVFRQVAGLEEIPESGGDEKSQKQAEILTAWRNDYAHEKETLDRRLGASQKREREETGREVLLSLLTDEQLEAYLKPLDAWEGNE